MPTLAHYPATSPIRWWEWVEIISSGGIGTITLNNSIVLVSTQASPDTAQFSDEQTPIDLEPQDIRDCLQQIPNASLTLPDLSSSQVSWINPSPIPILTFAPVAAASMCQWSSLNGNRVFWGFGYNPITPTDPPPPTPTLRSKGYGNPQNWHMGQDFFAREGSSVYSVADNGLVVGIGIGRQNTAVGQNISSGNKWGAAYIDNPGSLGYNIIVRYASIYVLYGHIRDLDPNIYVGKLVDAGVRLGAIGRVNTPHLHIEARNLGSSIPDGVLVKVPANPFVAQANFDQDNKYGILNISSSPGNRYDHDIGQFFRSPIEAYAQDFDSGITRLNITGFGITFNANEYVVLTPTAMRTRVDVVTVGSNCTVTNIRRALTTAVIPNNHGIRGFQNGAGDINTGYPAADPDINNTPPSDYPTSTIIVTASPTASFTPTP